MASVVRIVVRFFVPSFTPSFTRLGLASLAAAIALGLGAPAFAADLAAGARLANERCAACHGKDGNTPIDPSYARLSGQYEDYLVHALKAYRTDKRKNPIMGAQAKTLSNADIENVAAYYARQPGMLTHDR
jgi:cytochrome c553